LIAVVSIRGEALDEIGKGKDKFEKRNERIKEVYEKDGEELPKEGKKERFTEKEQQDILLRERDKAFPDYWWEPRVMKDDNLTCLCDTEVDSITVSKKNWACLYPYAMAEPLLWFWRTAQFDFDDKVIVDEKREKDPSAEWTSFLVVAADFYYCTGFPICKTDEDMKDKTLEKITLFFKAATGRIWDALKIRHPQCKKEWKALGNLHIGGVVCIKGRLKVRNPEKINQLLHRAAIKGVNGAGSERVADGRTRLDYTVEWPEMGALHWKEKRSGENILLKRMRKKQKPPEGRTVGETIRERNHPLKPVEVKIVNCVRMKPSHGTIKREIVWTGEEKKELDKASYDRVLREREERRLLHNREAKQYGFHDYHPFKNAKQTKLKCRLCGHEQETAQYSNKRVVGIDFKRMKSKCKNNKEESGKKRTFEETRKEE